MAARKRQQRTTDIQAASISEGLPSPAPPVARGKELRDQCPRGSHAGWSPPADRPDPLELIEESSRGRMPELIPVRYGRMLRSAFTFFRGAPAIMAADLARTPTTGVRVQACGDCHLLNFGVFATPERRLVFDLNDFDETLPAPWEWDVKRLAASFVIASLVNGLSAPEARNTALACVRSYREHTAEFARMRLLDAWYASIDVAAILAMIREEEARRRLQKRIRKARKCDVGGRKGFPRLAGGKGEGPVIRDDPPLIYHRPEDGGTELVASMTEAMADYRASLPAERRPLLDHYRLRDIAIKVVGVGSVGTRCAVALLMAGRGDLLFLQVKEARASVLEPYAGRSAFANQGERVVTGQRLLQCASDLFLGWTKGAGERHFYIRQLRDMKLKPQVELFTPALMLRYASLCGWALARAHARSGRQALVSDYLGKGERFDEAVAAFAVAYAGQNERDFQAFVEAARSGRFEVRSEA